MPRVVQSEFCMNFVNLVVSLCLNQSFVQLNYHARARTLVVT